MSKVNSLNGNGKKQKLGQYFTTNIILKEKVFSYIC